MPHRSGTLFVTLAPRRDLAAVRVLASGVARVYPQARFVSLSLDPLQGDEPTGSWDLSRLNRIENLDAWRFQRPAAELSPTLLPAFLAEILRTERPERLVYLDPFTLLLAPIPEALGALDSGATGVLIPRTLHPYGDIRLPGEVQLYTEGLLGDAFVALRPCSETDDFLAYWSERMLAVDPLSECALAKAPTRSLDLALTAFDGLKVLREPTYGVSYWNLHERGAGIRRDERGDLTLDRAPVRFVHFLGLRLDRPEEVSVHQNRYTLNRLPNIRTLWDAYREALARGGHESLSQTPGSAELFDDGTAIPSVVRTLWRDNLFLRQRFPQPFSAGAGTLREWLTEQVGPDGMLLTGGLPRLWHEIWKMRPDLQGAFPDPWRASRSHYAAWARSGTDAMVGECDPVFLPEDVQPDAGGAPSPEAPKPLSRRLVGEVARRVLPKKYLDALYFRAIGQPGFEPLPLVGPKPPPPAAPRGALDRSLPAGLNVAGFLTGEFGLGEAGRSIVHAVQAAKIPHVLRDFQVPNKRYNDRTFTNFTEKNPYAATLIMVNANELSAIERAFGEPWFAGRYRIGLWYWELPDFPAEWFSAFDRLDEIWVTSAYTAEGLSRVSPLPVVKVTNPIAIDTERVSRARGRLGLPEDTFLFVFSFDFHSYLERKNPTAVAEAFRLAFGDRKDVGLVFKTINGSFYPEKTEIMSAACSGLNVFYIDDYLDRYETFDLFKSCDALVSLHRAEGLGLGMAEAMRLGVPVIATGYSGNMDFMNVNNSLPVRYVRREIDADYGVYKKGQLWAEPDVAHAAECMKKLVDDRDFAARLGASAAEDMATRFSAEAAGASISSRLARIMEVM